MFLEECAFPAGAKSRNLREFYSTRCRDIVELKVDDEEII